MMKIVASHRSDNRMSVSALAACMAPLLLRPLLAGDCEFEDNFNMGGDGSLQLLKAAAAANHAQAIVIIMLEEYERIFDDELSQDESLSSESCTETEDDIEDDESTDNDILEDDGYHDAHNGLDADSEDDLDHSSSGTVSGGSSYVGSDISDNEEEDRSSGFSSPGDLVDVETPDTPSSTLEATALVQDIGQKSSSTNIPLTQGNGVQKKGMPQNENSDSADSPRNQTNYSIRNIYASSPMQKSHTLHGGPAKFRNKSQETASMRRPTKWGRTPARKNLSMESTDYSTDDENAIQRLETTKTNLETKVTKEVQGNAILQESLEKRKQVLHERRLSLEKDIISSPTDGVDLVTKSQTSLSSPKGQPRKKKSSSTNKNMMLPLEAGSISSNELPTALNNSTSRDKNTVSGPDRENRRPQTKDSCPSTDMKLSQQPLRCDEAIPVTSDSSSKKSASKGENPEFGADVDTDSEYRDAENQNLPTLVDAQPSQKLPRQMTTNQSWTKSNDTSSTEGPVALTQNFASKKSSFWTEDMKQESQNFPSMSNRQQYQRHQSSTSGVKDDTALVGCIAALKMSSGTEEPQDSSSVQNRELSQKHLSSVSGVKDDTALVGRNAVSKKPSRSEEPRDSPSNANKQLSQKHKSGTTDAKDDAALVGCNAASKKSSRSEEPQDSPSITNKQPSQKHQTGATGVKDNTALVTCPSSSKKSSKSEDQVGTTGDKDDTTLVARPASSKKPSKSEDQKGTTGVKDDTALVGRPASSKKSSKSKNQTGSTGVKDNTALVEFPASSKKSSKSEDQTSTTGVKDNTALVGGPASSEKSSKSEDQIVITCVKDDTVLIGRPAASKKSSKSEDLTGTCGVKYDTALVGRPATSKKSSKSEDLTGTTGVKDATALVRCPAASKKSSKSEYAAPSSSSSSALLRLTNRLNFLKERRLQLANEVQNLDAKRASGPDHPPRTNSR